MPKKTTERDIEYVASTTRESFSKQEIKPIKEQMDKNCSIRESTEKICKKIRFKWVC